MIWYVVVGMAAFVVGVIVGAWGMRRRIVDAQQNPSARPVRLPAQSEFLANADEPVGPANPPPPDAGPVPGLDRHRDQQQ